MKNFYIHALFFFLAFSFQKSLSQTRDAVELRVSAIDNDKNLKSLSIDKFGDSTEGTLIIALYDARRNVHKFTSTMLGEMGKVINIYYLLSDSLIYQKKILYSYSAPFYVKDFKTTIDSVQYNCSKDQSKCDFKKFEEELGLVKMQLDTLK